MSTSRGLRCGAVALGCAALIVVLGGCSNTSIPAVSSTEPANGATGVSINTNLAVTFSKSMNPQTITTSTFTLFQGTTPVPGTIFYEGLTAMFNPTDNLAPDAEYTATITTGAADLSGNALAGPYAWTFTTGTVQDTVAPVVSFTCPANGAAGAPINTSLTATFSEPMNPLSFTSATFTLARGATPVPGTVGFVGVTAIFKPAGDLAPNTQYTATITTGTVDLSGNAPATNHVWAFTTGTNPDTIAPMLSFTDPANGTTGVPPERKLAATFSKAMDPLSLSTATLTLVQGATPVPGTVTYSGVTAMFSPTSDLTPNTQYTATITTGARDLSGNALAIGRTWTFTTGSTPDIVAPMVSSVVPEDLASGVPVGGSLAVAFSKTMDPLTITTATFTLVRGVTATTVLGTVACSGATATFTPADALTAGTAYTASVSMEAADLAGNALAADYVWTFTTGTAGDTTAPVVGFTAPANGATGVPINRRIAAAFSKMMDPLTVTSAAFTMTHGATTVVGTVTYAGITATFNPKGNLLPNTQYTAKIMADATDLAGNALASDYAWTFNTGGALDTAAPSVSSTVPADGATGGPVNGRMALTFSKAMDPMTVTTATFTLVQGTTPVPGTVNCAGVNATFTPKNELEPNTAYTAAVSTEAADLAGNSLASDFAWSFTTGLDPDIIAPTVTSTNPGSGMAGVPVGQKVTASFSEPMASLTVTPKTFTLVRGTTPVSGAVTYADKTATFAPLSALAGNTTYTATVLMEATDLAGNALASDHAWTFTTGAAPIITVPTVSSTAPADGATGVPRNQKVTATFSEAMASATISTATFSLAQGALSVAGTVTYADKTATFTPFIPLAANTAYTATVSMEATDTGGTGLAADHTWSFTTGASKALAPAGPGADSSSPQ